MEKSNIDSFVGQSLNFLYNNVISLKVSDERRWLFPAKILPVFDATILSENICDFCYYVG